MEKNNSQQITFNKLLYSKTALQAAVLAFAELAQFSMVEDEKYFQVALNNIDDEAADCIVDEFANYVLVKMRK